MYGKPGKEKSRLRSKGPRILKISFLNSSFALDFGAGLFDDDSYSQLQHCQRGVKQPHACRMKIKFTTVLAIAKFST
ncbi:predicted protein [Sclerotinia sclerotiorum 1980 UF-70]|uniref:Uncharacterized protein n=1 Tax=Sclerotinia sclerotiorum (strain ATCC 18683 / 1980 / Ss-1) TaxID=665079 RepID=A7EQ72_SCLS1|nr:predicted protein [Sclerotinia sclerotiorum 1980 UF-70]EDO04988.1 predicted protein [Sclerotinia sclerotiorum 1980 UF-70]